jgi:hypothetical protein
VSAIRRSFGRVVKFAVFAPAVVLQVRPLPTERTEAMGSYPRFS